MSSNQRRTIRLPISPERAAVELRLGRRSYSGNLINESAGGLAVRVERDSPITIGLILLLGTSSGWSRARVTYAQRDEDGLYLGLQRLSDVQPKFESNSRGGLWMFDRIRMRRFGGDWSWYLGGAMIVFGVILATTLWQVMSTGEQRTLAITSLDRNKPNNVAPGGNALEIRPHDRSAATGALSADTIAGGRTWRTVERWLARRTRDAGKLLRDVRSAVATGVPSSSSEAEQKIENLTSQVQKTWNQLQDEVVLLLLPQVADKLQLTDDQRARIEIILRDSRQSVQQVYRQAEDKSSPEVWKKIDLIRKEAGEQALAQLTSKQQEMLVAMRTH